MDVWKGFSDTWKKEEEEKRRREEFLFLSEMCDCCGQNSLNIKRASFISKSGMIYVIRYCENCNPEIKWAQLNF